MPKTPDLTLSDNALAFESDGYLCAIKFEEAPRKANYKTLVAMMKRADRYFEQEIGENKKKLVHFAAFKKSKDGARLAYQVLEELRVTSWRFSLFANERLQKNKYALLNTLDCYNQAVRCKNHKAHCHTERETWKARLVISEESEPRWLIPCQQVAPFVDLTRKGIAPDDALDAAAISRNVNLCPLYDASEFRLIDGDTPKRKRKNTRKFW